MTWIQVSDMQLYQVLDMACNTKLIWGCHCFLFSFVSPISLFLISLWFRFYLVKLLLICFIIVNSNPKSMYPQCVPCLIRVGRLWILLDRREMCIPKSLCGVFMHIYLVVSLKHSISCPLFPHSLMFLSIQLVFLTYINWRN